MVVKSSYATTLYEKFENFTFRAVRKVRFKTLPQKFFFHKNLFFAKIFYQRVVWTWYLYFWKELLICDPLGTQNMFIWPIEKFLLALENHNFGKNHSFSKILPFRTHLWGSIKFQIRLSPRVSHPRKRLRDRMIIPFVLEDRYDPIEVCKSK